MADVVAKIVRLLEFDDGSAELHVRYLALDGDERRLLTWDTFRGVSSDEAIRLAQEKARALRDAISREASS